MQSGPSYIAGRLRELLAGNERYVFTLIQKFSTADREPMPVLSERSDIIVITDEAHRSQYDTLAANMRSALPNAAFIGFTGTPLIQGAESRKRVARELLGKVTDLVAGVDWLKGRQSRASVRSAIQIVLNELPEEPYPEELWNGKVEQVWDFVLRRYAVGSSKHT